MNELPSGPCGRIDATEIVIVDTETTGLAPFGLKDDGTSIDDPHGPDRLCSLAAFLMTAEGGRWRIVEEAYWTVDPQRPIPEGAARVNGFAWSPDGSEVPEGRRNLAGMPGFSDLATEFLSFVADRPLGFHHAAFDMAVLDAELCRAGLPPLDNPVVCTKKAFADILGLGRPDTYIPGTNLNRLCDFLGIDRSSRIGPDGKELHGAAVDGKLAAACMAALEPKGWIVLEPAHTLPHRRAGLTVAADPDILLRRAARA